MRTVKLDRQELLRIVTANKEKHIKEYEEAVVDYKEAVLKVTAKNHKLAKTRDMAKFELFENIPDAPTSYEKEYARAIAMLELSVDQVIEIEDSVFNQLVLDEWTWKHHFSLTNSTIKTTAYGR